MTEDTYIVEGRMVTEDENDVVVSKNALRYEIRRLLKEGIYHQDELFAILYPVYTGHYSVLREAIAEEKNYA